MADEATLKSAEDFDVPETEVKPAVEKDVKKKAAVDVKKINVAPAVTIPLALASQGGKVLTQGLQKVLEHPQFRKVSDMKDHPIVAKIWGKTDLLLLLLGLALIFHGAQFKNLFLCIQVITAFCFGRVKAATLSLHGDITTALAKMNEGSKADAKAEPKPTQDKQKQRQDDAASAKKLLKVVDSDKVQQCIFELCVAGCACHMVMQGGLAKVIVVARALVKGSKQQTDALLDFSGHEDVKAWTDTVLSFILYVVFGSMAVVLSSLALALNIAVCGAQLVTEHGARVAEGMGKIPGGVTADVFCASMKGRAMLGGLAAFGTMWQLWALMADSGMGWYFKALYFPAVFAEGIVRFL